jgi:5,6,7,8-tetrahydromethanopterin hydro-lyase
MTPQYGEAFTGVGVNAAHINTVLGLRDGSVGTAWATALATPSVGHARFVVVKEPNQPVLPMTLFVNKATIENERHGEITWGAGQRGVAQGVERAITEGIVPSSRLNELALIVAVWVNPLADDDALVEENNADATYRALLMGNASSSMR